jgi:hypothetical protein
MTDEEQLIVELTQENQRLLELLESHISKFNFYADLFCELEEQVKELTDG